MIEIPAGVRDEMVVHAFAGLPDEACGLLAGTNGGGPARATRFFPMANADHSRVTYRLEAKEQLQGFNRIEDGGLGLVGIFHSHTHSHAYPSEHHRGPGFHPGGHSRLGWL